jgi:hypothetical protein
MGVSVMLQLSVRDMNFRLAFFVGHLSSVLMVRSSFMSDDGKLQAESDSGEFWVLFGGFAPIGKKTVSDDDIVLETTAPKLYRYIL